MDETRSGSGQAESCLKALHSLVAYGHDSLTSLAPRLRKKDDVFLKAGGASSGQRGRC